MEQRPAVLATAICRPGLLRLTDLEKQIIFLLLKFVVAGLQGLSVIRGSLLLLQNRLVLCVGSLLLTLCFVLLLLIRGIIGGLLSRIRRGFFRIVMETFLNVLRQLDKIDLRDS